MLFDVEKHCLSYKQCSTCWGNDDGGLWCLESCRSKEKTQGFNLEQFITMLEQEKYRCADNELKATWNKAIKKAVLLVKANMAKGKMQ